MKHRCLKLFLLAFLFLYNNSVFAVKLNLSEEVDPEIIGKNFSEVQKLTIEIEKKYINKQQKKISDNKELIYFNLKEVKLIGNTVYSDEDLKSIYINLLNKKISFKQLEKIVELITEKYQKDGYVLSKAMLFPQKIKQGIVRIEIIEGYIKDLEYKTNISLKKNYWFSYYVQKLKAEKPIKEVTINRYLSLIDDIPGIKIEEVDYKFLGQGATIVQLDIKDSLVDINLSLNNRLDKIYGSSMLITGLQFHERSLGGSTGLIGLSSVKPSRLKHYNIEHKQLLNKESLTLALTKRLTYLKPKFTGEHEEFNQYAIKAKSDVSIIGFSYPIIRAPQKNLLVYSDLNIKRSENSQNVVTDSTYLDRISIINLGLTYEFLDSIFGDSLLANNIISGGIGKGLIIFGAKQTPGLNDKPFSHPNSKPDFTNFKLNLQRLQYITNNFYLHFNVDVQYSLDELPSSEEYSFGGDHFGRGYDSVVISGDHGVAFSTEFGHNYYFNQENSNVLRNYVFYDVGAVWNKNIDQRINNKAKITASSAGIGVLLNNFNNHLHTTIELAKPLTMKNNEGNKDLKIFFKINGFW